MFSSYSSSYNLLLHRWIRENLNVVINIPKYFYIQISTVQHKSFKSLFLFNFVSNFYTDEFEKMEQVATEEVVSEIRKIAEDSDSDNEKKQELDKGF